MLSEHTTNTEVCYHSTVLLQSLPYIPRAPSTVSFGEKYHHFQAKNSPHVCTAGRRSHVEKAREMPRTKAKINTQPFRYLAFTDLPLRVICHQLELFSARKHKHRSLYISHMCICDMQCVMCCSVQAQIQHLPGETRIISAECFNSCSHRPTWVHCGVSVWWLYQQVLAQEVEKIGPNWNGSVLINAGREYGENSLWLSQKWSSLLFSKLSTPLLLDEALH